MNISHTNELIKEIDIRIERANDKIMPRNVFFLLEELGVSTDNYFEVINAYLEFFKKEVLESRTKKDIMTMWLPTRMPTRIYKAIRYLITGKFEVEIKFVPRNPEEFYADPGPVEVLITNRDVDAK